MPPKKINSPQTIKKIIMALKQINLTPQTTAMLFEIFIDKTVPSSVIAKLIGVNPKTISKYYHDGILKRELNGNYDLIKTMQEYIAYLKNKNREAENKNEVDLTDDRKKIIHYRAIQEEIKTLQMQKELAPIDLVIHFFSFAENLIQQLYRRPHEIGPEVKALYLAGEDKKAEQKIVQELEAIVRYTIKELRKDIKKEGFRVD